MFNSDLISFPVCISPIASIPLSPQLSRPNFFVRNSLTIRFVPLAAYRPMWKLVAASTRCCGPANRESGANSERALAAVSEQSTVVLFQPLMFSPAGEGRREGRRRLPKFASQKTYQHETVFVLQRAGR